MTLQTQFNKFHDKIKLGRQDEAYRKARVRDTSITSDIKKRFAEEGYPVIDDFLTGSHSTSTANYPLSGDFDIDRALVIDSDQAPENPLLPKKVIESVLEQRGFKNAKIKRPCVTADYTSDNIHIDFTVYRKCSEQMHLAVGKKNADEHHCEWSDAAPKELKNWITDDSVYLDTSGKKYSQYRRIVRYLKRWRDYKFSEPVLSKVFSIALTVMAKECFLPDHDTEGFANDLSALRQTVNQILNCGYFSCVDFEKQDYKVSVALPVKPYRDLFHGSGTRTDTQLRNKLKSMLKKLEAAEALNDVVKQSEIMQDIFGEDFSVPAAETPDKKPAAVYPTAGAVGTSQGA